MFDLYGLRAISCGDSRENKKKEKAINYAFSALGVNCPSYQDQDKRCLDRDEQNVRAVAIVFKRVGVIAMGRCCRRLLLEEMEEVLHKKD